MTRRPSQAVPAVIVSAFVAASLVASPQAYAADNHDVNSPQSLVCLSADIEQRLTRALDEAKAGSLLAEQKLAEADQKLARQEKTVDTLEAARQETIGRIRRAVEDARKGAVAEQKAAEQKVEAARAALKAAQNGLAAHEKTLQGIHAEITALQAKEAANAAGTDELSQKVKKLSADSAQARATLEEKKQSTRSAQENVERSAAAQKAAEDSLAQAKTARDEADAHVRHAQQELREAEAALTDAREKNERLKQAGGKAAIERGLADAQSAFDRARQESEQRATELADVTRQVEAATAEKDAAKRALDPVKAAATARLATIADLEKQRETAAAELRSVQEATAEKTQELVTLRGKIAGGEQRHEELSRFEQVYAEALLRLDAEIAQLKREIQDLMQDAEANAAEIERKKNSLAGKQLSWESNDVDLRETRESLDSLTNELIAFRRQEQTLVAEEKAGTQQAEAISQRLDGLTQSLTNEQQALAQEQPTLAPLQEAFDQKSSVLAQLEAKKTQHSEAARAAQEAAALKQRELDAAKALKESFGADFAGDLDTQLGAAENQASQRLETAKTSLTAAQEDQVRKAAQVDTAQAAATQAAQSAATDAEALAGARRDEQEAQSVANRLSAEEVAARKARDDAHATVTADRQKAQARLLEAQRVLAGSKQAAEAASRALSTGIRELTEAEATAAAFMTLGKDAGIAAPLQGKVFAELEAKIARLRMQIPSVDRARADVAAQKALRTTLREDFEVARRKVDVASNDLSSARKLPACPTPPAKEQVPPAKGQSGQVEAQVAPQAKASSSQGLASTGAEDLSGVAALMAIIGAGAVVTHRGLRRR